jgi:hypothetical protein
MITGKNTAISRNINPDYSKMYCKKYIKAKGWTEAVFNKFASVPDKEVENPYYPFSSPMKLYDPQRIAAIEARPDFQREHSLAAARRRIAQKGVETKKSQTVALADNMNLPPLPDLSDRSLLAKIVVEYAIHHCMSIFPFHLIERLVGKERATQKIRDKILDSLGNAYPWLRSECFQRKSIPAGRELVEKWN